MVKNTISAPLRQFEAVLAESCMAAMDIASSETAEYAKKNHRYKDQTGGVTAATRMIPAKRTGNKITGGVENTSMIGLYLHEGTGLYGSKRAPYIIRAKNAKSLHFEIAGSVTGAETGKGIFVKKVVHPGIRPDPWISVAVHQNQQRFFALMNLAVQRACRIANKGVGK